MKKFEYQIIDGSVDFTSSEDELILNEAGKKGWELVSWIEGRARGQGLGAKRIYYFMKREVHQPGTRI